MQTQFLERPGGKIAYDDQGRGPLVICAPSMGDVRGEFRFLVPQITAAGFRAVCVDVRWHGESSPGWPDYSVGAVGSDLLALIDKLDAGPAVILGTSMAGGAGVWAAAEAPQRIAGLALIDAFVRDSPANRALSLLISLMFARPWGPAAWLMYYSSLYPTRKPPDFAAYRAVLRKNLAEAGRLEALHAMLAASKSAAEERLPRVKAPVLVLMGSKDPDFKDPAAEAQWIGQSLNGQVEMVDGAGHYPHAEMPEQAGPVLTAFIREVTKIRGLGKEKGESAIIN
jgi:pimeloyl-ACP methyl ester carboxylesterase